ncbi:hypothetical protein GYH30_017989 [Glycine max]|uniref:Uncharacterized protein n=2 Tax=Glycine subgen. Soja TaxID=1462606 RepID=A0A0R0J7Z1_SOYBN|nr:hypothetical protein GYH30_017989 [Glycine max]RZC02342.1 hypothetical protein D0Y65_017463 [Glycine soja]
MQKVDIKKRVGMKEVEEIVEEVQNELKNLSYLESGLRQKAIDWLAENLNKLAILKSLSLDQKEEYIMVFMS